MSAAPTRQAPAPRLELGKLFDRLPPHALEAEVSVLGAMLLDGAIIGDVLQIIQGPEDFYKPAHGAIYGVLVDLYDRNQPIDLVQVRQRLADLHQLDPVGGVEYLISLGESVPSAAAGVYHARIVREKALLRRLIDAAGRILVTAYTAADPVVQQLDQAEKDIFAIADQRGADEASRLHDLLQQLYSQLEAQEGRHVTGLETGFYELDEMTCGLQRGEMIIVAGRPSMGKTALALNMAEHIAAVTKQPTAVFSLEMSRQQLAQRLLCSRSGVSSQRLRRNILSADEYSILQANTAELADAPMFIDDTPGLTLLSLRARARRLAARHDLKAVFVDYLQLMACPGSESRQQEVSELSRGIKALARELNVPVVCLSQLNRAPESREGHKPRMSDLRESGSIEQDADVVMMIHREEYYHDEDWRREHPDECNLAEIVIAKQRNGPVGTVKLQFSASTTRFHNLATPSRGTPDVPPPPPTGGPAPF